MTRDILVPEVPNWHKDAACTDHPAEFWFPLRGHSPATAIKVCAQCPVRRECLQHALDNTIRWGVWGGKTADERAQLLRGAS